MTYISAVLVREKTAGLTPTVAGVSTVRTALVVNLLQRPPPPQQLRVHQLQLKVKSSTLQLLAQALEDRDKVEARTYINIYYVQDWSYLVALVVVSLLRSTCPPLANTVSCRTCRPGDLDTLWRGLLSVEEITVKPRHAASLSLMLAGRKQLAC